ncbi:Fe-S-cluster oxidoreductase [Duganella sp. Root336D2]|nr:Fe-S-cluster oxidoreductase [Duganella sp. Root336D2]
MPHAPTAKPAGVRCVQLGDDNLCRIFGRPERPAFCGGLQPSAEMCGETREQAMHWLTTLELATAP